MPTIPAPTHKFALDFARGAQYSCRVSDATDWTRLPVEERSKRILAELGDLDDWKERYGYILDLGTALPAFPEEYRRDEFKVKGCVSQVWLVAKKNGDHLDFFADSDSLFVKGLAALLVRLFAGLAPPDIAVQSGNLLIESGLIQNLSPNRVNGAGAMLARFKEYGRIFAAAEK